MEKPPCAASWSISGGRNIRVLRMGPRSDKPLILFEADMFSGAAS